MEACFGAHHLSRKLNRFGHDARLMPAKYVRPYSKGQKNDFRDAQAGRGPARAVPLPESRRTVKWLVLATFVASATGLPKFVL
jgi:transposase